MEPKRLYKSRTNRVLCGVCGGIGEYFGIDPTIVRLLCVFAWPHQYWTDPVYHCGDYHAGRVLKP